MSNSCAVLPQLLLKVERAKKHWLALEAAWSDFFNEKAYTIGIRDDIDKAVRVFYLASAKDIPYEIPIIVGDVIQNLRSALDHLAYQLVIVGTNSAGPHPDASFPAAEDAKKYKAMRDGKKTKGMREAAKDAIDAIEPYGGGKGAALWHLQCLNNIDKHRLLLTVWANLSGHSVLPSQRKELEKHYTSSHPGGTVPNLKGAFIPPKIKTFPLKAGDELLTVPTSELEEKMEFLVCIAFGEPKIVEGESVIDKLRDLELLTRHIIFDFDRRGLLS